jgi:short-subunit dehydrogenase
MNSFKDAQVIVTGAGSGIGLELVRQLYQQTQKILAVDYLPEALESLQSEFPNLVTLNADLSLKEGNGTILAWVSTHWTRVDFCFANAGKAEYGEASQQNWEEMDRLFQLNVHSPIQLGLALKQRFPTHPLRHVITCSAIAYWAIPGYSLYCSTKAALLQWADCLWSERDGDWLTLVFPIATATPFFEAAGPNIPRSFPMQSPQQVAKSMLIGAAKGKKRIFPSALFKSLVLINRMVFFLKPLTQRLELKKLRKWAATAPSR